MAGSFWVGIAILADVSLVAFLARHVWAVFDEAKVWDKLATQRWIDKENWGPS